MGAVQRCRLLAAAKTTNEWNIGNESEIGNGTESGRERESDRRKKSQARLGVQVLLCCVSVITVSVFPGSS